MKLSQRVFLYSGLMAIVVAAFILGYFILMLPSLYVDYRHTQDLQAVYNLQNQYRENDSCAVADAEVNGANYFTFKIPKAGYTMEVCSGFGSFSAILTNQDFKDVLDAIRAYPFETIDWETVDVAALMSELKIDRLKDRFVLSPDELGIEFTDFQSGFATQDFSEGKMIIHASNPEHLVMEASVQSNAASYTNYIGLTNNETAMFVTLSSTMTPQLTELMPIILQSLPMIVALVILLVIVSAFIFSRLLAKPIEQMAGYAQAMQKDTEHAPLIPEGKNDEFGTLARTLNQLYTHLGESIAELKVQNELLIEQKERQQLFVMASSHQLKTPVAAALLLIDGMIDGIGKYKDRDQYLLEVKRELLAMRKIIDEILSLTQVERNQVESAEIELGAFVEAIIQQHETQIQDKHLIIRQQPIELQVNSDPTLLFQIIDNIITNAVKYTANSGMIKIWQDNQKLCIFNSGEAMNEALLKNIFEPFIRSQTTAVKGHGLGLYIAAYYSNILHVTLTIQNVDGGILVSVDFGKENKS